MFKPAERQTSRPTLAAEFGVSDVTGFAGISGNKSSGLKRERGRAGSRVPVPKEGGKRETIVAWKRRNEREREREKGQPLFLRFVRCTLRRIALSIDGWVRTGQRRTTPPSVDPSCSLTLFLLLSRIIDDSSSFDSFLLSVSMCFFSFLLLAYAFYACEVSLPSPLDPGRLIKFRVARRGKDCYWIHVDAFRYRRVELRDVQKGCTKQAGPRECFRTTNRIISMSDEREMKIGRNGISREMPAMNFSSFLDRPRFDLSSR